MQNFKKYAEVIDMCSGAQNNRDVQGWTTVHYFDDAVKNKQFNAKVYKQGKRVVIVFAGSDIKINKLDDFKNDIEFMSQHSIIPSQLKDAEKLYNSVKELYKNNGIYVTIEFMGYSLGGSIANLMSHLTGLPSHAIAPVGSKHIAEFRKDYFKYDDSNITTYGREKDKLFGDNIILNYCQSGKIIILPDVVLDTKGFLKWVPNHELHNFKPEEIYEAKIYSRKPSKVDYTIDLVNNAIKKYKRIYSELNQKVQTNLEMLNMPQKKINYEEMSGWKNPIDGDKEIYTQEYINSLSKEEIQKLKDKILWQYKKSVFRPKRT